MTSVTLRPMTEQEYADYRARSVPAYASDLARSRGMEPAAAHQGRGFGRATILAAEELAREAGLRHIALNVFGSNDQAEGSYRSLGHVTQWHQMDKPLTDPT